MNISLSKRLFAGVASIAVVVAVSWFGYDRYAKSLSKAYIVGEGPELKDVQFRLVQAGELRPNVSDMDVLIATRSGSLVGQHVLFPAVTCEYGEGGARKRQYLFCGDNDLQFILQTYNEALIKKLLEMSQAQAGRTLKYPSYFVIKGRVQSIEFWSKAPVVVVTENNIVFKEIESIYAP